MFQIYPTRHRIPLHVASQRKAKLTLSQVQRNLQEIAPTRSPQIESVVDNVQDVSVSNRVRDSCRCCHNAGNGRVGDGVGDDGPLCSHLHLLQPLSTFLRFPKSWIHCPHGMVPEAEPGSLQLLTRAPTTRKKKKQGK